MNYRQPEININGWMGEDELQWLFDKASEMENVVEIGSWMGRSTHALLSGCKGSVYAIDHFKGSASERKGAHAAAQDGNIASIFLKNVGHFENLKTLIMDSIEASNLFLNKSVHMVFIDGEHEYPAPKNDIEAWLPKCTRLLCGHDKTQGGVPKALKELNLNFKNPAGQIWSIEL